MDAENKSIEEDPGGDKRKDETKISGSGAMSQMVMQKEKGTRRMPRQS